MQQKPPPLPRTIRPPRPERQSPVLQGFFMMIGAMLAIGLVLFFIYVIGGAYILSREPSAEVKRAQRAVDEANEKVEKIEKELQKLDADK